MDELLAQSPKPCFAETSLFQKIEVAFWLLFIALPFFTGLLEYHWLTNESFDEERHELLSGSQVGNRWEGYEVRPEMWQDKRTGEVFTSAQFSEHRAAEAKRLAATWFTYGLIGCFYHAWTRSQRKKESFFEAFGKAVALNLGIATYIFFLIRS